MVCNRKANRRKRLLAWAGGKSKTCGLGRCAKQASVPGMCLTDRWPLTEGCVKLLVPFNNKKVLQKESTAEGEDEKRKTLLVRSAARFLAFVSFRLQPSAGEEIGFFIEQNSLWRWAGSLNLAGPAATGSVKTPKHRSRFAGHASRQDPPWFGFLVIFDFLASWYRIGREASSVKIS